ncbi:acetylxylan esterase [Natronolimnobius sp. AArcel1]|uniref:glucuronyl esterase domain-containing protein n=1 Tax=Natronolimnobius sp. AArcel1 TaxID=1679093 RepID=UPI0013EC603D|nr:acetylxylan esterase [Natronolimnobius sp. AArcel1]NGM71110.1 acetylxylan esterase [Natronolimnobius sp. AArcel1]
MVRASVGANNMDSSAPRDDDQIQSGDGVELPGTEFAIPDDVTPVSERTPQADPPHVLEIGDGKRVESATAWREQRRPRLKALLRQYVYGYAPPAPRRRFDVDEVHESVFAGAATLKRIAIRFPDLPEEAPAIRLALFVPTTTETPSPVMFGLNMAGNHTVADIPALSVPAWARERETAAEHLLERGERADYWQVRETIDRGYAFATACTWDIHPDTPEMGLTKYCWQHHGDVPGALRGGALAAWAWGISRCVEYLLEDPDIRDDAIAAFGHSRAGKATLLAGALDERIALVVPHQSGTAGVALSRHEATASSGETVEQIVTAFPHWFNGYYPMFATDVGRFPIDQHHLVALVAPRAILATESTPEADAWTNPDAARLSIQLASDAWELLEDRSLSDGELSQEGGSIPDDAPPILHYRRDVEHTMTPDYWEAVYDFADQHLEHGSR